MNINFLNRLLVAGVMGSLWLAGMNVTTGAQDKQQPDQTQQEKQGNDKPQKGNNQQDKNRGQQKKDQRAADQQQQGQNNQRAQRAQQQQQDQNNQKQVAGQRQWQKDQNWQQQVQQHQQAQSQQQERLSRQRQQQLIGEQQQRLVQYRQNMDQRQRIDQEHTAELRQQGRNAQYRYEQQYWDRERQQQQRYRDDRHDGNDPFFYTASNYRYSRGGQYYETNQYGANMLRQAVNNGYQEGFYAGRADRQDGWRPDYQDSDVYQDANFGYDGYYVSQDDYNYYFRQGFQRGYGDGFYSRNQYGSYSSGKYTILGAILGSILDMESR